MTRAVVLAASLIGAAAACARTPPQTTDPVTAAAAPPPSDSHRVGPLVPATTTLQTAWDFPKNPLTEAALDTSRLSEDIRWGFRIFTNTHEEAARFTASTVSCNN